MEESELKTLENCSEKETIKLFQEFNKKNDQIFCFPEIKIPAKKKLVSLLFKNLLKFENSDQKVVCLESIRIMSRDKTTIEQLFSKEMMQILVDVAGLGKVQGVENKGIQDPKTMVESQKCLSNLIYNSQYVRVVCSDNGCIEGILSRIRLYEDPSIPRDIMFFDMRMLFLLTALHAEIRPKVRSELHGLIYLTEMLDLILKATGTEPNIQQGKRISDSDVDLTCEVLKVLFNLTISVEKENLEEEEEPHFLRLVGILHDIIMSKGQSAAKTEELQSHTIDLLCNMPGVSYAQLLNPCENSDGRKEFFEDVDITAIALLLNFLQKRLEKPHKTYKEALSPILSTLCACARFHSSIRRYLRRKILPPLKDVMKRPEEGDTLRNKLVKLMTSPVFDVKELVADFLFILCKENVGRLIKYTGYGNAAGLLAKRGLMLAPSKHVMEYSSDSEDSDTEEYLQYKDKINPVLGCYSEPTPNIWEGMTDEQKEHEAMELVNMMDRLSRDGLLQPMCVGEDGKPHIVAHVLELQGSRKRTDPSVDSD